MKIKIGTLNLCLGLSNKKTLVKQLILDNNIDVLCMQETELDCNLDHDLMSFNKYRYETEDNSIKSRVGCYINSSIDYTRRRDLEESDLHLVILDIKSHKNLRLINIYRPFNPRNGSSPREFFNMQLNIIRRSCTSNTIILGDFNLDWNMKGKRDYAFGNYYADMDEAISGLNLIQMVDFPTWSRTINNVVKLSTLDHIYSNKITDISSIEQIDPLCGDHCVVTCTVNYMKQPATFTYRRNWKFYNKSLLCQKLREVDWNCSADSVQSCWNDFENKLLKVIDDLVPITEFSDKTVIKKTLPDAIKTKLNRRKRLIKRNRVLRCPIVKCQINEMNRDIKKYYHNLHSSKVRKLIKPGDTLSLWKAVKTAKDINPNSLPKSMFLNGVVINQEDLTDRFASFFDNKIRGIVEQVSIDDNVYNGTRKIFTSEKMFMDPTSVKLCLQSLKNKNTEGVDRIPQKILLDGADHLEAPLSKLFNLIYNEKMIPDQWRIAKTIPVFKNKGDKKDVENYRPIANLCAASKVFEKLILKRILDIEKDSNTDITGVNQHGFKKARSTSTLTTKIQSLIAGALDEDNYVLLASLDLSAAFDIVNINLLLKRLNIIGLPRDVIDLVGVWLRERSFYVSIDGSNSLIFDLLLGTVQGSILGPILYAVFVSPLFDIEEFDAFADDTYIPRWNSNLPMLMDDMKKSLEAITKWLKKSGLKVNQEKTELCLFYKNDLAPVSISVSGIDITSKSTINVLGVLFDSRMLWSHHVDRIILKANKALNAIKILRKFFNTSELIMLVTSNYFSILYYNSEVWQLPNLNQNSKHKLFVASSNALKVCLHYPRTQYSYFDLHRITKRATPDMICKYKLALSLYKTFNDQLPFNEWVHLNFNQISTSRQLTFITLKNNNKKVGLNSLANRYHSLNGKIPLVWMNKPYESYKIECKRLFITFND